MKKTALFSTLFLAVFGLTLGITLMTYQPAAATTKCDHSLCIYFLYCTTETGSLCTNPELPYYIYGLDGECLDGNPGHICPDVFEGCCDTPGGPLP